MRDSGWRGMVIIILAGNTSPCVYYVFSRGISLLMHAGVNAAHPARQDGGRFYAVFPADAEFMQVMAFDQSGEVVQGQYGVLRIDAAHIQFRNAVERKQRRRCRLCVAGLFNGPHKSVHFDVLNDWQIAAESAAYGFNHKLYRHAFGKTFYVDIQNAFFTMIDSYFQPLILKHDFQPV